MISALRRAAAALLPPGAFLRRDRGDALFVTDAPRRRPDADWPARFSEAGFRCEVRSGLLRLSPDAVWLVRLEAEAPAPPDALCESLARFRGLPPEPESLALFTLGLKALDGAGEGGRFRRALGQRAAVCLRLNRNHPDESPRGGGLYACALLADTLQGGYSNEAEMAGTRLF